MRPFPLKCIYMKSTSKESKVTQKAPRSSKSSKNHKYIFVIGGVMSGVGKGITTSSIGTILQSKGYSVNIAKVDPYLNVDAGTMNPTEHGEVFVLDSGLETDQDMGNYERFLNTDLSNADYMTGGMVYLDVIQKERALKYRGKCVDAIPHIRDEIAHRIVRSGEIAKSDITIVEIGGTVGDYQSAMFYEAARYIKIKNPGNVLYVMVTYMPVPSKIGEMKSKPTQNAVHQLQSYGIQPDFIIGRSEVAIDMRRKEKIAVSCNVPVENVISAPDIDSVYDVPLNFERDRFGDAVEQSLKLKKKPADLSEWRGFVQKTRKSRSEGREVHIAVVGKYFDTGDFVLSDAYVSVIEALKFSSYSLGVKPVLHWVSSKEFEIDQATGKKMSDTQVQEKLKKFFGGAHVDEEGRKVRIAGVLVPGGFGETGIEGKISVIKHVRENKIPYFGICYGMQLMVIEYARHAAGLAGAQTSEIDSKAKHCVIDIMSHQKELLDAGRYGASMRLGGYACVLRPQTIANEVYAKAGWSNRLNKNSQAYESAVHALKKLGSSKGSQGMPAVQKAADSHVVIERHRHRYEVNPNYVEQIENAGLVFSGTSPDGTLMEIAELPRGKDKKGTGKGEHPFFLGVQFHPEFLARPLDPHPVFTEFVRASADAAK